MGGHTFTLNPLEYGITADSEIRTDLLEGIPSVGDLHVAPPVSGMIYMGIIA